MTVLSLTLSTIRISTFLKTERALDKLTSYGGDYCRAIQDITRNIVNSKAYSLRLQKPRFQGGWWHS